MLHERGLYDASDATMLQRLRAVRDEVGSVMLVGHNPGSGDLARLLAGSGSRLPALREKFPTGALASLELDGSWSDLQAAGAVLTDFVVPRELPRASDGL